jgi:cell division protein FtsW
MVEEEQEEIISNKPIHNAHQSNAFVIWLDKNLKGDKYIWGIIISLTLIGILVVYSATGTLAYKEMQGRTEHYLLKHTLTVLLALAAIWIAHRVDYRYYARLSRISLFISVPLLVIAWKFGVNVNEASRWLPLPLIGGTFQPSDLAKLALISSIAAILAKRQDSVDDFQETVVPILVWTGVICTLIGLTNVSTALLLFATSLILMFIGRVRVNQLILFVVVGFISLMLSLLLGQRMGTFQSRMDKFFNPQEEVFQAEQSYIAISTGGLIGKGAGNSVQRNYLPNPFSDFIYAIIVEEYGFLGGLVVLGLYLFLLYRGIVVVAHSPTPYGGILAAGLTLSLVLQAFLNIMVTVGMVPITGVPLPMLSMGGTSLLFTGISLGIILSVSRGKIDRNLEGETTENAEKSRT